MNRWLCLIKSSPKVIVDKLTRYYHLINTWISLWGRHGVQIVFLSMPDVRIWVWGMNLQGIMPLHYLSKAMRIAFSTGA